jgi:hypothetical protein
VVVVGQESFYFSQGILRQEPRREEMYCPGSVLKVGRHKVPRLKLSLSGMALIEHTLHVFLTDMQIDLRTAD